MATARVHAKQRRAAELALETAQPAGVGLGERSEETVLYRTIFVLCDEAPRRG